MFDSRRATADLSGFPTTGCHVIAYTGGQARAAHGPHIVVRDMTLPSNEDRATRGLPTRRSRMPGGPQDAFISDLTPSVILGGGEDDFTLPVAPACSSRAQRRHFHHTFAVQLRATAGTAWQPVSDASVLGAIVALSGRR